VEVHELAVGAERRVEGVVALDEELERFCEDGGVERAGKMEAEGLVAGAGGVLAELGGEEHLLLGGRGRGGEKVRGVES
jgi:hypothetical protein